MNGDGGGGGAGGAGAGAGGAGGAGPNPPNPPNQLNQLIAALNMLHQHNRCPIPIFSGLPNEDPTQFRQKALDYMEDALIPAVDRTRKFRLCLQGDARDWYNDIPVPPQWDVLMNMFCRRFCIFGQTEEQWHEAWQKLSFDRENGNIDQFISKVRRLAQQLQFRNESVLIKLKQLFPEKADTWLVVHNLDDMCGYLKKLYSPYQIQQRKESAGGKAHSSGATPFSNMKLSDESYDLRVGTQSKRVRFDKEELLDRTVAKLTNAMNQLRYQRPERQERENYSRRPSKPYKPYIMKGRDKNEFRGRTSDRDGRFRDRDRSFDRRRSFSRDPRNRYPSNNRKRPFQKFDRSPTSKRPRSSSRPVDKDKDRCYHCHQHGHFARECPQNKKDTKKLIQEVMQEMRAANHQDAPWREPYDMDPFQNPEPSLN